MTFVTSLPPAQYPCARCGKPWSFSHPCLSALAAIEAAAAQSVALQDRDDALRELLRLRRRLREEKASSARMLDSYAAENQRLSDEALAAQAEVERLRAENQALAEWQCIHLDGKTGLTHDERGNAQCAKDAPRPRTWQRLTSEEFEATTREAWDFERGQWRKVYFDQRYGFMIEVQEALIRKNGGE